MSVTSYQVALDHHSWSWASNKPDSARARSTSGTTYGSYINWVLLTRSS
ncbi:hypothetical protein LP419_37645 [Massilia sp. H-1]|nr:hypothetical protein LP419_37645 [Massilia sp. H-1]